MKIKANNANSPIWKDVYSHSKLPQQLEPLNEIATNLWWVWNHEGAKLFGKIDKQLWKSTEGNPVQLLQSLSHKRMEEILADKELMAEIQKVYADFKAYINVKPDKTQPSVAYFSMEYGLTNVLKIYSGGLGVLAGDYLKEASDSNIDLCAVGFLFVTDISHRLCPWTVSSRQLRAAKFQCPAVDSGIAVERRANGIGSSLSGQNRLRSYLES